MPHLLYAYSEDGGNATIYDKPFMSIPTGSPPLVVDEEVMRTLALFVVASNMSSDPKSIATSNKTQKKINKAKFVGEIADIFTDTYGTWFDHVAVIEQKEGLEDLLKAVGQALLDTMEGDSSCYKASEVWGKVLESHAVHTFPIPVGNIE